MRRSSQSVPGAGQPARPGAAGLIALTIAVATLAAGCAAGPGSSATAGHRKQVRLDADRSGGPPSGTRAGSVSLGRRLLAEGVLPHGAKRLPQRPVPAGLRSTGGITVADTVVDRYHLYRLPMPMARAERFLAGHRPARMSAAGTCSASGPGAVTSECVMLVLRRPPRGIDVAGIVDSVTPGRHGTTLMRADAQVSWYPPRSAAEHLRPASYHAVRITAWLSGTRTRKVTRTFSSRLVIARLTSLIDGLPASPGGVAPCPQELVTFRLAFKPAAGQTAAIVSTLDCRSDAVLVGGKAQPDLADSGRVAALVLRVLHLRQPRL
jgi:hypothetical protein